MIKILCLGNEFLKEDSFAKEIARKLMDEIMGFSFVFIKDSFQMIEELNSSGEIIILDVVEGLNEVKLLEISELKNNKIITAHDFDAGFVLKLFSDKKVLILGIPMQGNIDLIKKAVKDILDKYKSGKSQK